MALRHRRDARHAAHNEYAQSEKDARKEGQKKIEEGWA
jgi:hypothetical protein